MRIILAVLPILILTTCARAPRPSVSTPPGVAAPQAATIATCKYCPVSISNRASSAFGVPNGQQPNGCKTGLSNGFLLPDPGCTPGAENPTVTLDILRSPAFRTGCIRNCVTTDSQKQVTYGWYGIPSPTNNTGDNQTCELDHLVPLELGGADTLDNIWPQCGPAGVSLKDRYFKQKDLVENYLTRQVKSGAMDLEEARHQIATDWTPFLAAAKQNLITSNRP
jgi:hypothetical protein